jgi:hypothetical protein
MQHIVELLPNAPDWLKPFLDKIGFSILENIKMFLKVFKIPSDADDSGCNLALGSYLRKLREKLPAAYNKWE